MEINRINHSTLGVAVAAEMAARNKELRVRLHDASLIIVQSSSHGSIHNDFTEKVIEQAVSF